MSDAGTPIGGHKSAAKGPCLDGFAAFEQDMLVDLRALAQFGALSLRSFTAAVKAIRNKGRSSQPTKVSYLAVSEMCDTETSPQKNSRGGT